MYYNNHHGQIMTILSGEDLKDKYDGKLCVSGCNKDFDCEHELAFLLNQQEEFEKEKKAIDSFVLEYQAMQEEQDKRLNQTLKYGN